MNSTRETALDLVQKERDRQDEKWGQQDHRPSLWVGILGEEFGEYCQAVNETVFDNGPGEREKGGYQNMIRELSHVAAVAVAAMECLIRKHYATCVECGKAFEHNRPNNTLCVECSGRRYERSRRKKREALADGKTSLPT